MPQDSGDTAQANARKALSRLCVFEHDESGFVIRLRHDPLRSNDRSPLFHEHSRIRVLRGVGLGTLQIQNQPATVFEQLFQWQGGT